MENEERRTTNDMLTPRRPQRDDEAEVVEAEVVANSWCGPGMRLFVSFWLFGTLIAMQFSVVITAANDLVADRAPTGLVLFAYTLPSVLVRTFVPFIRFPDLSTYLPSFQRGSETTSGRLLTRLYNARGSGEEADKFYSTTPDSSSSNTTSSKETIKPKRNNTLTKQVNYPLRLSICVFSSFCGLQLLAWADVVGVRLVGIAMASLSSNLGDMSFLQLCSHYPAFIGSASAFGGYTTGGGSAGLLGAFLYTFCTSTLQISPSATISVIGIFPVTLLFIYAFLLPWPADAGQVEVVVADPGAETTGMQNEGIPNLPLAAKLRIVRPMFWRFMAPLAALMLVENTTVQGILPILIFYLPFTRATTPLPELFNSVFRMTRDFYPAYITAYQFSIFVGRSSISFFRLPASSVSRWFLVVAEVVLLSLQMGESLSMGKENDATGVPYGPLGVLSLTVCMGMCAGLSFSNTYWKVNNGILPRGVWEAVEKACGEEGRGGYVRVRTTEIERTSLDNSQQIVTEADRVVEEENEREDAKEAEREMALREFLLSTIAPPDTFAILLASLVGMKVQPALCAAQVAKGRELCRKTRG